jgi:hypothetical protein
MSIRALCIAALLLGVAREAAARDFAARLAAGPAWGHEFGGAGLVAAQLTHGRLRVRGDLQATLTGASASWERSVRALTFGVAAGFTSDVRSLGRWYVLANVSDGLDLREGDRVSAFGALAGWEMQSVPLFAEVRYEHWLPRGVQHYDLPINTTRILFGLIIN